MRVLILGITGMLGSTVFREFSLDSRFETWGSLRAKSSKSYFAPQLHGRIISDVDVQETDSLTRVLNQVRPQVVINCVGLIKQLAESNDPLVSLPVNSMMPHRLASLCELVGARLVHISTDCVFDGKKGNYLESDPSDATDLYGKSKYIGELHDKKNAITLRTSIIGHEFNSNKSLVDWFLSQEGETKGYTKAIFSGLPTIELARVIRDYVLPHPEIYGLYHVSAAPIDKFHLLSLVAEVYGKKISIHKDEKVQIDRSLDSSRFQKATGYKPPAWPELIKKMYDFRNFEVKNVR